MRNNITLMYHDVYLNSPLESGFKTDSSILYKLEVKKFEEQVKLICNKFRYRHLLNRFISFSFDDGGNSFFYVIAPILEKYNLRGIFFVTSNKINENGFLTDEQIKDLDKRGHIIGAHSHSHPLNMKSLSNNTLFQEWSTCCTILTQIINKPITVASIPGGSSSKKVFDVLGKCGIRDIYTSSPGLGRYKYHDMNIYYRYAIKKSMTSSYVLLIISNPYVRILILIKSRILNLLKLFLGKSYFSLRMKLLASKKQ